MFAKTIFPVPDQVWLPRYCNSLPLPLSVMVLPLPKLRPPEIFKEPLVTPMLVPSTTLASVPVLALMIEPLALPSVPPFRDTVALPPRVAAPPPAMSVLAFSTKFNLPKPVALMLALILILLCAFSVSVTSVLLTVVRAPLNTMFPSSTPPALVVIVTLVP